MGDARHRIGLRHVLACAIAAFAFLAVVSPIGAQPLIRDVDDAIVAGTITLTNAGAQEPEYVAGLQASASRRVLNGATYWIVDFRGTDGSLDSRFVIASANGVEVTDPDILKQLGGWDAYLDRNAFVGDWTWATVGIFAGLLGAVAVYFWLRRPRTGAGAWFVSLLLWSFVSLYVFGLFWSLDLPDTRGVITTLVPCVAIAVSLTIALLQRRGRYAYVELTPQVPSATEKSSTVDSGARAAVPGGKTKGRGAAAADSVQLRIVPPERLPSFSDVGGMDPVKDQLRETVGMIVAHGDLVRRYGIDWNGVLLYGPPGVGKTFIAKATAGEFGLNFIDVRVSDLISRFMGESSKLVADVFRQATQHRPCILFFDEFDSVAQRREDAAWDTESTRVVNQLLRELENAREVPDLLVMAATNHKDTLDEAAIRPGRFDRHISIDLPDDAARRKVFETRLQGKPVEPQLDLSQIVTLTAGMSAADIATVVNGAALEAVRRSVRRPPEDAAAEEPVTLDLLLESLKELRSKVRPTVDVTSWDDLVLDSDTKAKLMDVQEQIERFDELTLAGVEPPRGILLYGPPGTGKTTIAKVFASQADASFFAVDASELISMWLGESQKHVARLFAAARRSRPSIVFIDEIDALVPKRSGDGGSYMDDVTSQFLREIDGIGATPGVFVVGATNVPDALDPALLRGGRMSRQILIPLPGERQRAQLFRVHTGRLDLAVDVDFDALARMTGGMSGADVEEICNAAALSAFRRGGTTVEALDFETARAGYRADRRKPTSRWESSDAEDRRGGFGFAASTADASSAAPSVRKDTGEPKGDV